MPSVATDCLCAPGGEPFACTLIVARTHLGPEARWRAGEAALHQAPLDAWDRLQPLDQSFIVTHALSDLATHALDGLIQHVNVSDLFGQQKAMMRLEQPFLAGLTPVKCV